MNLTFQEAEAKYGKIENGVWADEAKHCVLYNIPIGIQPYLLNSATGRPATHIYCNYDMAGVLDRAFNNLFTRKLEHELKTFDGCFMLRDVRGEPGKPSWHSYALAIDLNAKENGLGQAPQFSDDFVKCFTDAGFIWGGLFHRKDGMHFQLGIG